MRWQSGRRSSNVEDRRGGRGRAMGRGTKVGGGTILLVLILSALFGQNPLTLLQQFGSEGTTTQLPPQASAGEDEAAQFVSVVLGYTEDTWNSIFAASGSRYREPVLVLYEDAVNSACGYNTAATGPFYCPGDEKMYLDLSFLRQLQRMGASGDFAVAYVIAHEVGHHIQNITGIEPQVRAAQRRSSQAQANQLSVLMELQADCYAGVWAHHTERMKNILEKGDIEEGLRAAAAVGDDRLQEMAGQRVQPEAFTHGSSQQRMQWFQTGLQTGSVDRCDTFAN